MAEVQTATGPVPAEDLGLTLSHEHLFIHSAGLPQQYPWLYDRETAIAHVVAELREASEAGVRTIVDVTTPDLGRDIGMIAEASARSGVRVVACTGIWSDIPTWFRQASVDEIADVFVHEIEAGIAGTEIRAGVIKVANNRPPGIGEVEEKVLRGAARAAQRTGVPVTTHTSPYDIGLDQMRIFADEGLPGRLASIGHSYTDDVEYLLKVVAAGHYLSIDHFGPGRDAEPGVVAAIARLCEQGHAGRVTLGHDHVAEGWDWRPHEAHASPSRFTHVPVRVRAALSEAGVSPANIETMLVAAPAAFLAGGREA